jgi:hypothetical protein
MRTARILAGLILLCAVGTSTLDAQSFASRTSDLVLTGGLWLSGNVSIDDYGVTVTKNTSFMLKACYDGYLIDKLAMGLYVLYSPATWGQNSNTANVFQVGGSIKPRFIMSGGAVAIKPGLLIGYRTISSDMANIESAQGLAIDASVEFQFESTGLIPTFEIGFLTQPVGGNDYSGISWAPIFYVGGGVAF